MVPNYKPIISNTHSGHSWVYGRKKKFVFVPSVSRDLLSPLSVFGGTLEESCRIVKKKILLYPGSLRQVDQRRAESCRGIRPTGQEKEISFEIRTISRFVCDLSFPKQRTTTNQKVKKQHSLFSGLLTYENVPKLPLK